VPTDSTTETYAALRLEVDNWRWAGVPFYLRTGKRLARKVTEIAVTLKPVPHLGFRRTDSVGVSTNQLILTMQPDEGVSLSLAAKIPGRACACAGAHAVPVRHVVPVAVARRPTSG
jgi:glucose-6-phosphate 1-dehydrogenase